MPISTLLRPRAEQQMDHDRHGDRGRRREKPQMNEAQSGQDAARDQKSWDRRRQVVEKGLLERPVGRHEHAVDRSAPAAGVELAPASPASAFS